MSETKTVRAAVSEVSFGEESFGEGRASYRARSLDGRHMFQSLIRADQAPALGDVFLYTIDGNGRVLSVVPEAPELNEQKFNEWISQRMGMENFLSEPGMTQALVRDAFMAGRAEVRPRDYLMASEVEPDSR